MKIGDRGEEIPFSSASSEMVKEASREAENLNSELIEPEHILLAILKYARGQLQKTFKRMKIE
jgi:ATP-dependent Clp protease ATP-binding subunit ClpA